MAKLGEAILELKTDSTALVKGLRDAERSTEDLARKWQRVGQSMQNVGSSLTRSVTVPLAAVGAAFTAATIEAGKYADKILDIEQITGLSTDSIQELEHVATIAGVSFEGLTGTIQKFTSRLPQIEAGTSESAKAFDALGVSLRDSSGNVRDMEELFPELIRSLQGIENVTERNAIAQQVFGRSLGDLAPVLGMTAEQFEAAKDEAHELGLVMSGESLNAANDYRVEIETLGTQLQTLWRNFAVELIPVIRDTVIPAFQSLLGSVQTAVEWFGDLDEGLQKTILFASAAAAAIGPAIGLAGKIMSAAGAIKGLGVAFGLSNPLLAAFLVTLTAIVAGVGFLIHRARTAAQERELLTNAITGNVESIEEYNEALEIQQRQEANAVDNIVNYQRGIVAARQELQRLRESEEQARSEGAGEDLLANNLRRQREIEAEIRNSEATITRIRSEQEEARTAIIENRHALEQRLIAEQQAAEEKQAAAMEERAARLQEQIDAQLEGAEDLEDTQGDVVDTTNDIGDAISRLAGPMRTMRDLGTTTDSTAAAFTGLAEKVGKSADMFKRAKEEMEALPPAPIGYDGSGRPNATPQGAGSVGAPASGSSGGVDGSAAAGAAGAAMIAVAQAAMDAFGSIEGFSDAIDPLGSIMQHMATVLTPIITSLLPIVLGLYERLGTILGELLLPIFEVLGPILEIVADVLMSVLMPIMSMFATQFAIIASVLQAVTPILNALAVAIQVVMTPVAVLAGVFNWLGTIIRNLGQFIKNVVDKPLRPGTWGGGMVSTSLSGEIRAAVDAVWTDHDLPGATPIDVPDAGDAGGGTTGAGATYRQARPITINQDISDNFFLGGDRSMRDFALMMKEELELLGVLNA